MTRKPGTRLLLGTVLAWSAAMAAMAQPLGGPGRGMMGGGMMGAAVAGPG